MLKLMDNPLANGEALLKVSNKTSTEAEILIYGPIGDWGDGSISAKDFADELGKLPATVKNLTIRINSGGGDVFQGWTIFNRLNQFKAKKTVYIDGIAASMASVIALAGDEIFIGEGAIFMIHLPWTGTWGNRIDFENVINHLTNIEDQMVGLYSKKSGMDKVTVRTLMEKETYMDADTSIKNGFVHSKVEETLPLAASIFDAKWIVRKPQSYLSEDKARAERILNLKKHMSEQSAQIARD